MLGLAFKAFDPDHLIGSQEDLGITVALVETKAWHLTAVIVFGSCSLILSELYLLSAALKRWEDEGRQESDFPLLAYCMESGFNTIEVRLAGVFANLPNRIAAWILRFINQPFGARHRGPADTTTKSCAKILLEPFEARDRVTSGLYLGKDDEAIAHLERAFTLVIENEPIAKKLRDAGIRDWRAAAACGLITASESERMAARDEAVAKVVAVDDFAADALSPMGKEASWDIATLADRARQSIAAS